METVFTHHLCVFPHPHDAYVHRLFGARDPTNCKCVPLVIQQVLLFRNAALSCMQWDDRGMQYAMKTGTIWNDSIAISQCTGYQICYVELGRHGADGGHPSVLRYLQPFKRYRPKQRWGLWKLSLTAPKAQAITIFADFGPPRTVFNHVRVGLLVLFFLLFISFTRVFDAVCLAGSCFCVYFYLFFIDFILFQAPRKYELRRTDRPMYEWNFHKGRLQVITKKIIVLQIQNSCYKTNLPNQS